MILIDHDEEMRKQMLAESAERAGVAADSDPDVAAYRRVVRCARMPLDAQLPAGFAASVAAKVALTEEVSIVERWAPGLCVVVMVVVGLLNSGEILVSIAHQLGGMSVDSLPWSMLSGAVLSLAAVGLSERFLGRGRA